MDTGKSAPQRHFDTREWREACSSCSLQELCIPVGLSAQGLANLEEVVDTRGPLHKGDHLFRQGEIFQAIYAVRSGYLKTYIRNEEGEEHVLGFYMAGELLGLDSINAGRKQCSAEVLDTALVCRLPFQELSRICRELPELQNQLLRLMSRELVTAESLAAKHSVEGGIAAFLLGWGERLAQRGFSRRHFILPMSRQDIASYLNLAPETVTRCLKRFIEAGWIEVARREINVTDEEALARLCPDGWRL